MTIPEVLRALDAQIARLQQARQLLSESASTPVPEIEPAKRRGRPPAAAKPVQTKPTGKRTMSDEGKARIAAAQKKRWAKSKKAAKAAVTPIAAKKTSAPAKKAPAKKAAAPVKPAAPAKAVTKKVAAPVKKASIPKKPVKAPQAAESAEPANSTTPPAAVEEIAAEA